MCSSDLSVLKGQLRRHAIEEFYVSSTDRIRDIVLGAPDAGGKRPGMAFAANGMRIVDVDVLEVALADGKIRALLEEAQHDVVRSNIDLSNLARELAVTKQREAISRETAEVKMATRVRQDELARELAASELVTALARIASALRESDERKKLVEAEQAIDGFKLSARLERVARERDQELAFSAREQAQHIELLRARAEAAVQRFTAAQGSFSEALLALGRNETLVKVAEAWSVQRLVEGESLGDTLSRLFHNTPLKPLVDKLVLANGSGG